MTYTGKGIEWKLFSKTYIVFELPAELMEVIDEGNISATYVDRVLGLLPVEREVEIYLDKVRNQLYWETTDILGLDLGLPNTFTLDIGLKELPVTESGKYEFYAVTSTSPLVQLSLLSNNDIDRTELPAPRFIVPPVITEPVQAADTEVSGTGTPNTVITLSINGDEYEENVNEEGNFSVSIPRQRGGTTISAALSESVTSSEAAETVVEGTLSFQNVPESLSFKSTKIQSGLLEVPRANPEWSLEVHDSRVPGSRFSVLAKAEKSLRTVDGSRTLPDALVYVDESGNSQSLSKEVEVYSGQTGENPVTSIKWSEETGPMLKVDGSSVRAETYRTTIEWTLVDDGQ